MLCYVIYYVGQQHENAILSDKQMLADKIIFFDKMMLSDKQYIIW
jgi:hypothetical protein